MGIDVDMGREAETPVLLEFPTQMGGGDDYPLLGNQEHLFAQ